MATPTDSHAEPVNDEPRSQGTFVGYLAIGLAVFALLVAAFGLIAGASHGWN